MAKEDKNDDIFEGREMRSLVPHNDGRHGPQGAQQVSAPVRGPDSAFAKPDTGNKRVYDGFDPEPSRFLPLQGQADLGPDAPGNVHVNQPYGSPINRIDPSTGQVFGVAPTPEDIALHEDRA